ncbi:MAG TPA: hypothetical protein VF649_06615 [Sphingomonas sp.]
MPEWQDADLLRDTPGCAIGCARCTIRCAVVTGARDELIERLHRAELAVLAVRPLRIPSRVH